METEKVFGCNIDIFEREVEAALDAIEEENWVKGLEEYILQNYITSNDISNINDIEIEEV